MTTRPELVSALFPAIGVTLVLDGAGCWTAVWPITAAGDCAGFCSEQAVRARANVKARETRESNMAFLLGW